MKQRSGCTTKMAKITASDINSIKTLSVYNINKMGISPFPT